MNAIMMLIILLCAGAGLKGAQHKKCEADPDYLPQCEQILEGDDNA